MQNGDHPHSFSQPGPPSSPLQSPKLTHRPGLVLPTQLVQNQIHELAKTLPPPRKQNTACDACRQVPLLGTPSVSLTLVQIPQGQVQPSPRPGKGSSLRPNVLRHSPLSSPQCQVRSIPRDPPRSISSPSSIVCPKITPARGCLFASPPCISPAHFSSQPLCPAGHQREEAQCGCPQTQRHFHQLKVRVPLVLPSIFGCGCTSRTRADVRLWAR